MVGVTRIALIELKIRDGAPYANKGPRGPGKRARRYRKMLIADGVPYTARGLQSVEGYEGPVIEFIIKGGV